MAKQNTEEEEDLPEYLNNPIMNKYVGRLHLLIDDLYAETEASQAVEVEQLKDVLMSVHRTILFEGKLDEINRILRMHYPSYYEHPDESSIDALINYPTGGPN